MLFGKPDVLLLDEPTNHLDLESIRWLENFLINEFKGTLVVVSHDRHFLNAVATHIADVDYQTITVYTGNYDDFVDAKYENNQRAALAGRRREEEGRRAPGVRAALRLARVEEQAGAVAREADRQAEGGDRGEGPEALQPRAPVHHVRVREAERPRRRAAWRTSSKTFKDDKGKEIVVYKNARLPREPRRQDRGHRARTASASRRCSS